MSKKPQLHTKDEATMDNTAQQPVQVVDLRHVGWIKLEKGQ